MLVPTLGMSSYVNLPVLDSFHLRCHDLTAISAEILHALLKVMFCGTEILHFFIQIPVGLLTVTHGTWRISENGRVPDLPEPGRYPVQPYEGYDLHKNTAPNISDLHCSNSSFRFILCIIVT